MFLSGSTQAFEFLFRESGLIVEAEATTAGASADSRADSSSSEQDLQAAERRVKLLLQLILAIPRETI